jgi:hypothetical protein
MAKKENKGGFLSNDQLEKDLKTRGETKQPGGYHGMQDTGERSTGNPASSDQHRNGKEDELDEERD